MSENEENKTNQETTENPTQADTQSAEPAQAAQGAEKTAKQVSDLEHSYYEVDSDLLSKPNMLVDILITDQKPTLIFCNQPSEADLVHVVFKKRQLSCEKMIGRVPAGKVAEAAHDCVNGKLDALVVTDISARDLDAGMFAQIVNYGIHEDPEIYLHRSQVFSDAKTERVISLVSPVDHNAFHYLKKVIDFDIKQADKPNLETIQKAKLKQISEAAKSFEYPENNEDFEALYKQLESEADSKELAKYFAYLSLVELPEAQAAAASNSRGNSRGRKDQSERRSNNRKVSNQDFNDEEARILKRNIPKTEYTRFYVGMGSDTGSSQEKIQELLTSTANFPAEQLYQYTDRGNYAFVDVLKAHSSGLADSMDGVSLGDNSDDTLVFKKAAKIVVTEEQKNS